MHDLIKDFQLDSLAIGHLTTAVQLGFIVGTIIFALFTIADRYSPSKVFFISAFLGALFNLGVIIPTNSLASLIFFRFLTGFFLAGIYPVGMKIAADYYERGLGKSLSFLVGALVLGTAFPHLLKGLGNQLPWRSVIIFTSTIAIGGGILILKQVADGPFRKPMQKVDFTVIYSVFKNKAFRSAAIGYFGHMWELYAFWTFVPLILEVYLHHFPSRQFNVPLSSFSIISVGSLACVLGGYISQRIGTKKAATLFLLLSCLCCLLSPILILTNSELLFFSFLFFWGATVIADSPLFSTLVAQNVKSENKGTALTIVNSIGFAITIISIQLLNYMGEWIDSRFIYLLLAIGPLVGLINLFNIKKLEK